MTDETQVEVIPVEKTILQSLIDDGKNVGLNVAEDAAKDFVKLFFMSIPKLISLVKNPTIKMVLGVLASSIAILEPKVMEVLDKIDGEVG